MPTKSISPEFEVVDSLSSSIDSDVSVIRNRESGEHYLLKSLKDSQEIRAGAIDRKRRFKHEMDIVSSLDHPNIARPAFSLGDDNCDSIVYPYRKGITLATQLAKAHLAPIDALQICRQLLDALDYIHCRGIIHCDINPNNIYIDDDKGLQLLDFGIAMTEDEAAGASESRVYGSWPYLSPEQMGFTAFKIDARSDLYCTALILYRLLAGKLPFDLKTNSIEELLNQSIRTEVQPIHRIPITINEILLKALKPTPSERYQTAAGFNYDLLQAAEHLRSESYDGFIAGRQDAVIAVNRSRLFAAREREVDSCKAALDQFLQGKATSVCIHGKSGIGKTEIVREFRRTAAHNRCFFLSVKCNSFTPQQPYSTFRHLILDFIAAINSAGKESIDAFSVTANKLLIDYSGVICKMVPEMKVFFREVKPIDVVESDKEADRITHVLFTLISTLCSFRPLILYIDDLQWIDRVSFGILRRLFREQTLCMVITTMRSENLDGDLHVYDFDIRKLGIKKFLPVLSFNRSEIRDFISMRFGAVNGLDELAELLAARTDCSPFALTEAFRFLVNNGILAIAESGWSLSMGEIGGLPEKLDPLSIILGKIKNLNHRELEWLETASLAEGKFQVDIIEKTAGFSATESAAIAELLENAGFIKPHLKGDYRFSHDFIQESIRRQVPSERRFVLYAKFGAVYEALVETDREYLFHAAEAYLKSKDLAKAIALNYEAARFAVEKVALDVAASCFSKVQLMISHCAAVGVAPPVDIRKMRIEFADVLALTGRNEQALKMYEKILNDAPACEKPMKLDLMYKIGTIHHNTGNFELSLTYFYDALRQMKIRFHSNKLLISLDLCVEIVKQILFSFGLKSLLRKTNDPSDILAVRILNKLAFSLFFKSILQEQHAHFRALNMADLLPDCAEKSEAYSCHVVASFMLFLKKRARNYLDKATAISQRINRKDMIAFANSFGGVMFYYNSEWSNSESRLRESIEDYKRIGDKWGQVVPNETLAFVRIKRGQFKECQDLLDELSKLEDDCQDKRGIASVRMLQTYIKLLNGLDKPADWSELITDRESVLANALMNKVYSNFIITNRLLFNQKIQAAYVLSESIIDAIKSSNLIQEYVSEGFTNRCEILVNEYHNRHFSPAPHSQLPHTDRALLSELRKFCIAALVRGIMYPAHRGAAWRAIAWYQSFRGRRRLAKLFFHKAIKRHHELDMRYEEAKSIAQYAAFFEMRHQPGLGRDHYNQAYRIFESCGALVESDRIRAKVDPELTKGRDPVGRKADLPAGPIESADQIRVDALYEASLSLAQAENIDVLLHRIVELLIRATGAQQGLLRLEGDGDHEEREVALDYDNRVLPKGSMPLQGGLIQRARSERRITLSQELTEFDAPSHPEAVNDGSALCVPLVRGDHYLGYVYLANRLVAGLFSNNASKAAQIISAQASFLIENARLTEEYKRLNARLEEKVREQTTDIGEKIHQLAATNLKLVESDRMKELLSGTIVHDIKNFAAGITGHVKLISYRHTEDRKTMRNIDLALESCGDIINLASNLLDISKMEEGKLAVHMRRLFFEELAAIGQKFTRSVLFDEKQVAVSIVPPKGDFSIDADPYLIERVFQNLFSNAAKYTETGGTVELSFAQTDKEAIISFFSSGVPIPVEHRISIFEKYSRIDKRSSQYSKGLGLFFCRTVMTAHQGRIWLEADERGNHFRLGFIKRY